MVVSTEYTQAFKGKPSFPASTKVYQEGSSPSIRVPFRQIALNPTTGRFGQEDNAPLSIYDTSGPYSERDGDSGFAPGVAGVAPRLDDGARGRGRIRWAYDCSARG